MTNAEITLQIAKLEKLYDNAKGTPCEIYSRCVGYFRPIKDWNLGKRAEFHDRVTYNVTGWHHG